MRVTVLLLCGLGLAAAAAYNNNKNNNNNNNNQQEADKQFLQKQQDVLFLFFNVQQPSNNPKEMEQANAFNFNNQQKNSNNPNAVKQFQNAYQQGLQPRGEVFNYNNPNQLQQAIQLFDLFYFAKDYDTFYQAACWARSNVNEGHFVYAVSVAILNRADTQGIVLPHQSEVYPHLYINTQAIQQAQNKKQQGQSKVNVQSNYTNSYVINKQQQQQQQQQGQNNFPFNKQNQNQYDNENQANQYQNQQQQNQNQEGRVSYYNEDLNLNQQFAYEQLKNPAWFNSQKYQQNKQQNQNQNNGENFYYYLQQALARYNLERYANDLPNVQPFQFNQNIQPGYNPQLRYVNGQAVAARPNNINVNNANVNALQQFQTIDRRVADAVDSNVAIAADGSKVQLNAENGAKVLGNIVQNNGESVNNQYYAANNGFYGYVEQCRKVVGSVVNPDNQFSAPSAIENDNSANRDPVFYQCVSRVVNYFQNFKNQQKPYNQDQLNFQGVQVQAVNTDKLTTYFDNNYVDLYNAINYQQDQPPRDYHYYAQQQQLNSKPFNYQIQVNSDKNTAAVVRVFIGPKYNAQGQQNSLEQARQNFVEIDRFTANLKNGQNNIQRNSQQSTRFVQQQASNLQLLIQLSEAQKGGKPFYYNPNQSQQQAVFPQNLILPKGSNNGQEYVFAVAVNSYEGNQQDQSQQDQPQDKRPQGFPFDRVVREANFQQAQNIFFQTVKVFNKNQNDQNNQPQH